jgi:hypothetical protein
MNSNHPKATLHTVAVALLTLMAVAPRAQAQTLGGLIKPPVNFLTVKARYGLTTVQNCVRTPFAPPTTQGIDPATGKLLTDGEAAVATGSGVMQFNLNGTVTASILGAELAQGNLVPGLAPLSTGIKYNCSGTYKTQIDQSLTVKFPSCTVTTANPNVVVTVAPLELSGYVGGAGRDITLTQLDSAVQTVAVSDTAGRVLQARQRVCVQSMSLNKL